MCKLLRIMLAGAFLLLICSNVGAEEEQKQAGGPPPMLVATTEIVNGKAEPTAIFIGTIYFSRTAKVAAEVAGIVREVHIDDGFPVKKGDQLARLDDELLATDIEGTKASVEQNRIELEQAKRDFQRITKLHEQDSVATSEYEGYSTRVSRLQMQAGILNARLNRMLLEQKKKTVRAPFNGLIVEHLVEAGEWVGAGGGIATIADNHSFEVQADIPARVIPFLKPGKKVNLQITEKNMTGQFISIIPRGDISTRTFVAKFSLSSDDHLIEGMEAKVILPTAETSDSLLVPRDAIVRSFGKDAVFVAKDGLAKMVEVEITGYSAERVGIKSPGLAAGVPVIVKGNERVRDGQPIRTE